MKNGTTFCRRKNVLVIMSSRNSSLLGSSPGVVLHKSASKIKYEQEINSLLHSANVRVLHNHLIIFLTAIQKRDVDRRYRDEKWHHFFAEEKMFWSL